MNDTLKFCKVRNVKSPNRAHPTDAGIDFYMPTDITEEQMKQQCKMTGIKIDYDLNDKGFIKNFHLAPNQTILIPSGIHVRIPDNYALIFFNKSGVATKRGMVLGACVVDQCYAGEIHINMFNCSNRIRTISAGDKIVQGILIPMNYAQTEEVKDVDTLYDGMIHDRGAGGFGSTGKK